MLKNIPVSLTPEILYLLSAMGHGDELILADSHFPGKTYNDNVIYYTGIETSKLLEDIMTVFTLDTYVEDNIVMMKTDESVDTLDLSISEEYMDSVSKHEKGHKITYIPRFDFYERSKTASAIIITSNIKKYANLIIKKGVTLRN